jgi:hypothetical protein
MMIDLIKKNRQPGELGLFSDISNDDYHSGEGVSNTKLGILLDNPARLYDKKTETAALSFGRLVDDLLFTPAAADKNHKAFGKALRMIEAVKSNKAYNRILTGGHSQLSGYFKIDGVMCKIRPDYVKYFSDTDTLIITDLKTTKSCNPYKLRYSIKEYGYYRQAAFYIDGMKKITGIENIIFVNYFVESILSRTKDQLFNHIECLPVAIPDDDKKIGLNLGRDEYMLALERYKHCKESGYFKGYAYTLGQEENLIIDITQGI